MNREIPSELEPLPAYEMDDGPLSASDMAYIRTCAAALLPKGPVRGFKSLTMEEAAMDTRPVGYVPEAPQD